MKRGMPAVVLDNDPRVRLMAIWAAMPNAEFRATTRANWRIGHACGRITAGAGSVLPGTDA